MKTLKIIEPSPKDIDLLSLEVLRLRQDILGLYKDISKIQQQLDYQVRKIRICTSGGHHFVSLSDILYCKADGNYCQVFLEDGQKFYISKTLKSVEGMICHPNFLRIHQSFLVNSRYVRSFEKENSRKMVLVNGEVLAVSRNFEVKGISVR